MPGTSVFKRIGLTLSMAVGAFVSFYVMVFSYYAGFCLVGFIAQVMVVNLAIGSAVPLFWRTEPGLKVVGLLWTGAFLLLGLATLGG